MMDELMEILEELRPDVDFANETKLITDGILDSFDIVALVGELNDEAQQPRTRQLQLRKGYARAD